MELSDAFSPFFFCVYYQGVNVTHAQVRTWQAPEIKAFWEPGGELCGNEWWAFCSGFMKINRLQVIKFGNFPLFLRSQLSHHYKDPFWDSFLRTCTSEHRTGTLLTRNSTQVSKTILVKTPMRDRGCRSNWNWKTTTKRNYRKNWYDEGETTNTNTNEIGIAKGNRT